MLVLRAQLEPMHGWASPSASRGEQYCNSGRSLTPRSIAWNARLHPFHGGVTDNNRRRYYSMTANGRLPERLARAVAAESRAINLVLVTAAAEGDACAR